jgi:hypothetical protein
VFEFKGGRQSLSPAEIYNTLAMTAIDMDDPFTAGFDVGFVFGTGAGLVNASAALHALVYCTVTFNLYNSRTNSLVAPIANGTIIYCTITFNLYNSRTNSLVAPIANGTIIASPPPCGRMNIEAVVPCAHGDAVTLEQFAPYFLFDYQGSNVYERKINSDKYGIRARVKSEAWSPFTNFTMGWRCG